MTIKLSYLHRDTTISDKVGVTHWTLHWTLACVDVESEQN